MLDRFGHTNECNRGYNDPTCPQYFERSDNGDFHCLICHMRPTIEADNRPCNHDYGCPIR